MASSFEEIRGEALRRWEALNRERPWIRIGTAICGKAAGAEDTLEALRGELERRGLEATVSEVGCLGLCFAEPLVDIMLPGGPRVFYPRVTPERVPELLESHLVRLSLIHI